MHREDWCRERAPREHGAALVALIVLVPLIGGSAPLADLMKWEVFRHTEYSAILLLDDDVDFFLLSGGVPPTVGSAARIELDYAWSVLYPRFLASSHSLVASSDSRVPINGAVWA